MPLLNYPYWLYPTVLMLYWVIVGVCIVSVLRSNRNPVNALIWVLAMMFLPVVGVICYIYFGRSLRLRLISRKRKRKLLSRRPSVLRGQQRHEMECEVNALARLTRKMNGTGIYYGNNVEVFTEGAEKFEALKADLMSAVESINLEYYIFRDDNLGTEIANILCAKAREGVKVRVLYDHVGSFTVKSRFFTKMRNSGVEAHPFFRVTFPTLANRVNWRNHRKIVIIDNKIGYIGGMNIADRYMGKAGKKKQVWRDTHLRLTGPAVAGLYYAFAIDWNYTGKCLLPALKTMPEPLRAHGVDAQIITGGPNDEHTGIANVFFRAIANAHRCVYIQTPYFLPPEALLKALETAAQSGVDVRVIIPRHSDSHLLNFATYSYIFQCLRAGIKIYMYEKGMLHSKNLIVDDDIVITGSANFDFRSFECNFEADIILYGKEPNVQFRNIFFNDLADSTKITLSRWRHRPAPQRMFESLVRLLAPIL